MLGLAGTAREGARRAASRGCAGASAPRQTLPSLSRRLALCPLCSRVRRLPPLASLLHPRPRPGSLLCRLPASRAASPAAACFRNTSVRCYVVLVPCAAAYMYPPWLLCCTPGSPPRVCLLYRMPRPLAPSPRLSPLRRPTVMADATDGSDAPAHDDSSESDADRRDVQK